MCRDPRQLSCLLSPVSCATRVSHRETRDAYTRPDYAKPQAKRGKEEGRYAIAKTPVVSSRSAFAGDEGRRRRRGKFGTKRDRGRGRDRGDDDNTHQCECECECEGENWRVLEARVADPPWRRSSLSLLSSPPLLLRGLTHHEPRTTHFRQDTGGFPEMEIRARERCVPPGEERRPRGWWRDLDLGLEGGLHSRASDLVNEGSRREGHGEGRGGRGNVRLTWILDWKGDGVGRRKIERWTWTWTRVGGLRSSWFQCPLGTTDVESGGCVYLSTLVTRSRKDGSRLMPLRAYRQFWSAMDVFGAELCTAADETRRIQVRSGEVRIDMIGSCHGRLVTVYHIGGAYVASHLPEMTCIFPNKQQRHLQSRKIELDWMKGARARIPGDFSGSISVPLLTSTKDGRCVEHTPTHPTRDARSQQLA
ncbi:hypothetical protein FPV67DRAFT_1653339 [Lyophyllum atratum]|nr:hypothetical protein FPV67DRAFT_1653339 [Lyophyllum atratum]